MTPTVTLISFEASLSTIFLSLRPQPRWGMAKGHVLIPQGAVLCVFSKSATLQSQHHPPRSPNLHLPVLSGML